MGYGIGNPERIIIIGDLLVELGTHYLVDLADE